MLSLLPPLSASSTHMPACHPVPSSLRCNFNYLVFLVQFLSIVSMEPVICGASPRKKRLSSSPTQSPSSHHERSTYSVLSGIGRTHFVRSRCAIRPAYGKDRQANHPRGRSYRRKLVLISAQVLLIGVCSRTITGVLWCGLCAYAVSYLSLLPCALA